MKIKPVFEKIGNFFVKAYQKVGKKNLIVATAILLLCGAVYVNYRLFSSPLDVIGYGKNNMADAYGEVTESGAAAAENTDSYFSTTVMGRTKARDEAMSVLQKVVDSAEAMEETRAQAFADMSQIAKDIENEANIEALVAAKGFEDCIAVVNGGTVSIVVKSDGLLPSEVAQINEIVYEQSGALPANIKIVERS